MFAWRHRDVASRPVFWFNSLLLVGSVGCSNSPCSGDSCPTASATGQNNPTSPSVAAEAGVDSLTEQSSSSEETVEASSQCEVDEDCHAQAPVCAESGQCVACLGDDDCSETRPYCKVAADEKKNRCVACQKGTDCGTDGEWECIDEQCFESCDPESSVSCSLGLVCVANSAQAVRYCAECGPGAACADPELVCVENTCLVCNPETDEGCASNEHCQAAAAIGGVLGDASAGLADPAVRCVECRAGVAEDCPNGTCIDGTCEVCDPNTNAGCSGDTPVCQQTEDDVGLATRACVQCVQAEDCAQSAAGPRCVDNQCAACEPEDDSGCSGILGTCVDIAPEGAKPLYECRECEGQDSCAEGVCVDFGCVECAESEHCLSVEAPECTAGNSCAGCTSDAACSHRPRTPVCDTASGDCVPCNRDADCAGRLGTPACDTEEHDCVECTNSSHCPDNPGGCLTFPGQDRYTCAPDDTEPTLLGACARCNAYDCADGLVCAEYGEDYRCLPAAEPDDPCGPEEHFSADDLVQVLVCVPENCAE